MGSPTADVLGEADEATTRSFPSRFELRFGHLGRKAPCDVDPAHESDVIQALRVIDKSCQRVRASRVPGDPWVQSDRHHPPDIVAVVAQSVQTGLGGFIEMVRAAV